MGARLLGVRLAVSEGMWLILSALCSGIAVTTLSSD